MLSSETQDQTNSTSISPNSSKVSARERGARFRLPILVSCLLILLLVLTHILPNDPVLAWQINLWFHPPKKTVERDYSQQFKTEPMLGKALPPAIVTSIMSQSSQS